MTARCMLYIMYCFATRRQKSEVWTPQPFGVPGWNDIFGKC